MTAPSSRARGRVNAYLAGAAAARSWLESATPDALIRFIAAENLEDHEVIDRYLRTESRVTSDPRTISNRGFFRQGFRGEVLQAWALANVE